MEFGTAPKSLDDERYLAMKRTRTLGELEIMKPENLFTNPEKISRGVHILQTWEPSLLVKLTIAYPMVISVLQSLGTSRHYTLIDQVVNGEVIIYFIYIHPPDWFLQNL